MSASIRTESISGGEALNVALNKSECLVSKTYIGYDKITNVCTGKTFDVSWGGGDWVGAIMVTLVCLLMAAICVSFIYMIARD